MTPAEEATGRVVYLVRERHVPHLADTLLEAAALCGPGAADEPLGAFALGVVYGLAQLADPALSPTRFLPETVLLDADAPTVGACLRDVLDGGPDGAVSELALRVWRMPRPL